MKNEQLTELFPAFGEISDTELREKALDAARLAMTAGGWDETNLGQCPVTLGWENCDVTLVEHVNDVAALCIAEFDRLEKYYRRHGQPFDRDLVVCGALLHDIGKMTEFIWRDGKVMHGDNYNLMRHPLSGAILAARSGLPDEIVHLIATHSFEGDQSFQTNESAFVRSIDLFVFHNSVRGLKKKN